MVKSKLLTLGIWFTTVSASLLSLKILPFPYVWIFPGWSLTFLWTLLISRHAFVKILCINLTGMLFILFIAEGYFAYQHFLSDPGNTHTTEHVYDSQSHPILGSVAIPNTQRIARKFYKGNLSYQATITIDSNGYRKSPPYAPQQQSKGSSLLFFGCSYTFGEGVNDEEAMPYITGLLTNGEYKIFNFPISGYGPQHMLAAIEHKIVDSVVDVEPRYIIYQAIIDHVYRVAGYRSWVDRGPQYVLDNSGGVTYAGSFAKCKPSYEYCLLKRIYRNLKKSYLLQRLWFHQISSTEIDLFLKVVNKSKQLLAEKYPEAEFHVIFWSQPSDPLSHKLLKGLREKAFNVHLVEDIIPDIHENWEQLYGIPYDGHPTALVHKKVAEYIVRKIINSAGNLENPLLLPDSLTLNHP